MSRIAVKGNNSGTGTFTIAAPNSNTDRTFDLPDEAGTVLVNGTSQNVGIGTTSPSTLLDLENAAPILSATATNGGSGFRVFVSGTVSDTFRLFNLDQSRNQLIVNGNGTLLFDSGFGSVAAAYGCRAWVNFDGTGTVSIRGSGNVSSITDNGTGNYTVNFASSMPDSNYSVCGSMEPSVASRGHFFPANLSSSSVSFFIQSTDSSGDLSPDDPDVVSVAVFR